MTVAAETLSMTLIVRPKVSTDTGLRLPEGPDNLFERLIRDPTAPQRPARERQCTEMLCGVLLSAPVFRRSVFGWLGGKAGCPPAMLDGLDWQLNTEQAIGSKRDDLRIEGWRGDDEVACREILWTVEVKVAAPLHESTVESFQDDEPRETSDAEENEPANTIDAEDEGELVSQLRNYDNWLARQSAAHKAGFVLGMHDLKDALPDGLQNGWYCLTWTELARQTEHVLAEEGLPPAEELLVRHMLGFVRKCLWRPDAMSNGRIEFEDVALLKAFAAIGVQCERKIDSLVAGLVDTIREAGVNIGDITSQKTLYRTYARSVVYFAVSKAQAADDGDFYLMAGVCGDNAEVWLECKPRSAVKEPVRKTARRFHAVLAKRNTAWWVAPEDDTGWCDLWVGRPLAWLLVADDQQAALNTFVAQAIVDLKEVGFFKALEKELAKLSK